MKKIFILVAALLFACCAYADDIDKTLTMASPGNFSFTWPEGAADAIQGAASYQIFWVILSCGGDCVDDTITLTCITPSVCDSASFGETYDIPASFPEGIYTPAPGFPDQWHATLTIKDPDVAAIYEPGTAVLEIFGVAMVGLLSMWLKTNRGIGQERR